MKLIESMKRWFIPAILMIVSLTAYGQASPVVVRGTVTSDNEPVIGA